MGLGTLVLLVAAVWLATRIGEVLTAVVGAAFLAAALEPAVAWGSRLRLGARTLGRTRAALLAVLLLVASCGVVAALLVPILVREAREAAAWLPGALEVVRQHAARLEERLGGAESQWVALLREEGGRVAGDLGRAAGAYLFRLTTNALGLLSLVIIPVGSYYLLADGPALQALFLRHFATRHRGRVAEVLTVVWHSLSLYIRGQTAVCLAGAILYSALFAVVGLPNPILLGALAGAAEAVPFFGSLGAAALVAVAGLADGPGRALIGVGVYLAVGNTFMNYVLSPRLLSARLDIHPFVVMLATLTGASLGGFLGALLALPTAVVLQSLAARYWARDTAEDRSPAA